MSDLYDSDICLRKGKWTAEEENYANFIIDMFNQGRLLISEGTTLRAYLSEKLKCDPMRITKKYAGESSIGKQVFHSDSAFYRDIEAVTLMEKKFFELERAFLKKIHSKYGGCSAIPNKLLGSENAATRSSQRGQRQREKPLEYSDYYTADKLDSLDVFEDVQRRKIHRQEPFSNDGNASSKLTSHRPRRHSKDFRDLSHELNHCQNVHGVESLQVSTMPQNTAPYSKRSLSTPNLSSLEAQIALRNSQYQSLLFGIPSNNPKKSLTDEYMINDSFQENSMTMNDPFANRKRSHSSMALVEFDKLVRDDDAADSFFMEFVSTIQDIKRVRTQNQFQQQSQLVSLQSNADNCAWARLSCGSSGLQGANLVPLTVIPTSTVTNFIDSSKDLSKSATLMEKESDASKIAEIVIDSFHSSNISNSRENSDLRLHLLVHQQKDLKHLDLRQHHVISSDDESGNFF